MAGSPCECHGPSWHGKGAGYLLQSTETGKINSHGGHMLYIHRRELSNQDRVTKTLLFAFCFLRFAFCDLRFLGRACNVEMRMSKRVGREFRWMESI